MNFCRTFFLLLVVFSGCAALNELRGQNTPIAVNDDNFGYEGTTLTGNVGLNDSDPNGDPLTFSLVTGPPTGTFTFSPNGDYVYVPLPEFNGYIDVIYSVCDPAGNCAQATLELALSFVNDPPVITNDEFFLNENNVLNNSVATNDYDVDVEPIFFTLISQPSMGTVTLNYNTGNFNYTPPVGYLGDVTFVYQGCDPCGACGNATVTIHVITPNFPPVTQDDSFFMYEDGTPISGSVATNDSDPENDPLTFAISDLPEYGTVSITTNGSLLYTPPANYFGTVTFTYAACDPYQNCTIGYVTVEVSSVNDPPVANDDNFSGNENTIITGNTAANDEDIDDPWDNYFIDTQPLHGTLTMTNSGFITYTPVAGFFGADSAVYNMIDPCGANDYATIYFNVIEVNDPPLAGNDNFSTNEDQTLNGSVAFNDSDPNGDALAFSVITVSAGGNFTLDNLGNFLFTPAANYNGVFTASYKVQDTFGAADTATVLIQILPVNDPPVVQGETYNMPEGAILNGNLALNDSDVDGDNLVYTVLTGTSTGVLNVSTNGVFSYSPPNNYSGVQTFTYQVSDGATTATAIVQITVFGVNGAPIALNDSFSLLEDNTLDGDVSLNDSDPDNDQLIWTVLQMPMHGTLELQQFTGAFTYIPQSDYNGSDAFQYQVDDGFGGLSTANVTLTIQAVNDVPMASDDSIECAEDGSVASDLLPLVMDVDNASFTFSLVINASHGEVALNADGAYSYSPSINYHGDDSFIYQVNDGSGGLAQATIHINVLPVNDSPVLLADHFDGTENTPISNTVATNDTDVDGDVIHYTLFTAPVHGQINLSDNGSFVYTPNAQYFGNDSFTVQGNDGNGGTSTSVVTIALTQVNNAPVAVNDAFQGQEDNAITGNVSLNDSDIDDTQLTFGLVTQTANGFVVFASNGQFIFTPDSNWNGSDSFSYFVQDPSGLRDTAVVAITVNAVNDAPSISGENFGVLMNQTLSATVATNDSDLDGDLLAYTIVTQPAHGTLTLNTGGSFSYVPTLNYFGSDSFTYQACDAGSLCDIAVASIVITENNHPPVVLDETFTISEDSGNSTFDVSLNDSDPDGNPLIYALISNVAIGSGTLSSSGQYQFLPPANYNGTQLVQYQVCDLFGDCTEGTLTIVVTSVNDNPIATNVVINSFEDLAVTVYLSNYVTDADNDNLTYTLTANPAHGTANILASGQINYQPESNYNGSDLLSFQVCDPYGACDTATVLITIGAQNDSPTASDTNIVATAGQAYIATLSNLTNDVDGNLLSYASLNEPMHGVLQLLNNGTFTYTAFENFAGVDSFTYNVCDPLLWCTTATVYITIVPFNHPPVAGDQLLSMCQNETASIPLIPLIADQDQSSNTLQLTALSAASGVVFFDSNSMIVSFQPNDSFTGSATIDYTICDSGEPTQCASGTITIQVSAFQQVAISNAVVHPVSCHGGDDGYVIIDAAGVGNLSYVWSNGANPAALSAGTYSVTILDDGNCSSPITAEYTVTEPDPIVVTDLLQSYVVMSDYTITGGVPPYSYIWQNQFGQVVSNEMILIAQPGSYRLTITDSNQCVYQSEQISIVTGIEEVVQDRQYAVYPNPGSDRLHLLISGEVQQQLIVKVMDAQGRLIQQKNISVSSGRNNLEIDMTREAPGNYKVLVIDDKAVHAINWIKQ